MCVSDVTCSHSIGTNRSAPGIIVLNLQKLFPQEILIHESFPLIAAITPILCVSIHYYCPFQPSKQCSNLKHVGSMLFRVCA